MDHANNPLGYENVSGLLKKFAIPSIVSMLVNSLYNIVDQIFIGQGMGKTGNAATNVAFPITTITLAIALMIAQGTASKQNLELGAKNRNAASKAVGNGVTLGAIAGVSMMVLIMPSYKSLLVLFGADETVLPYAAEYVRILLFGVPFAMLSTAVNATIRADGSPTYAMLSMLAGAVINTILDPIFIFGFGLGMTGAALATIIGQIASCLLVVRYVRRYKHVTVTRSDLRLEANVVFTILRLGLAGFMNQIFMALTQIVLNNSFKYYGALSRYGSVTPIAASGVISKVTMLVFSIYIGIAQGTQPIISFNYGAKQYDRVKKAYLTAAFAVCAVGVVAFTCFQLFPGQIISIFGVESQEYYDFAVRIFKINLAAIAINGIQPLTSNMFTSIGKSSKGIFVSMTRQLIFLIPLILILPIHYGIDGIVFAAPIADTMAFTVAAVLTWIEFRKMSELQPLPAE